jgi:hypothetical protein
MLVQPSRVAAQRGTDTTDQHEGTRLLVAYDPNERLPSLVLEDRVLWVVGAGIGVVIVLHAGVVIADQRRRRVGEPVR